LRRLEQILAAPPLEMIRLPAQGRFIRFSQVDSRTDPRVQVADLLAGVARKVAADELLGRRDPNLTALLRPYVDSASRWCSRMADPGGRLIVHNGSARIPDPRDRPRSEHGPAAGRPG